MCAKKKNNELASSKRSPAKNANALFTNEKDRSQKSLPPKIDPAKEHTVLVPENENIFRELNELKKNQEAKFFLAAIVESTTDSIVTVDFNNVITSWNKSAEKLYGYPASEAIGKSLALVTLPEDLKQILLNIDRIKHSKLVKRFETVRKNKDGQLMDLEIELSPVKNDAGEVIGVSTIARNITERKRRELNLAFLAEINIDFAPLLTVQQVMDMVSERLVDYLDLSRCHFSIIDEEHDRVEVVYEYQRDKELPSIMGVHRLSDNFSEDGKQHFKAGKTAVMNDVSDWPLMRTEEMLKKFGFGSLIDIPHLEAGKWKFLLSVGRTEASKWRNDEVELLQLLSSKIYTRIERARAEEELQRSELKLRRLSDSGIVSIAFFDTEGAIIEANDAFLDMLGVTRQELNSEKIRWDVYTHEAWMARTRQAIEEFKQTGQIRPYEKQFYHTSGDLRWGIFSGADMGDGKTGVAFVVDITERKRAEEALHNTEKNYRVQLEKEVEERTKELKEKTHLINRITDVMPDLLSVIDLKTLRASFSNKKVLEQMGFDDLEKMTDEERAQLIFPDDRLIVKDYFDSFATVSDDDVSDVEYRAKIRTGEWRWFHARGKVFARDEKGKPTHCVNVVQNIDKRKIAEQQIENLNANLIAKNKELGSLNTELKTFNSIAANNYSETLRNVYINLETIVTSDARNLSNSSRG